MKLEHIAELMEKQQVLVRSIPDDPSSEDSLVAITGLMSASLSILASVLVELKEINENLGKQWHLDE